MSQGTVVTAVLWVISLGAHLAMEVGIIGIVDVSTMLLGKRVSTAAGCKWDRP
jgi:hypothetical protein